MSAADDGRSLGELVASAADELSGLVHDEIALARAELRQDFRRALWGSAWAAAGAAFALFAFALFSVAAEYGLRTWLDVPVGVSCSVIGIIYVLVAGWLIKRSVREFRAMFSTERSVRSARTSAAVLSSVRPRPRPVPADKAGSSA